MERDDLKTEVEQLLEANRHYHEHTEELTHKISEITVRMCVCLCESMFAMVNYDSKASNFQSAHFLQEGNLHRSEGLGDVVQAATQTESLTDLDGIVSRCEACPVYCPSLSHLLPTSATFFCHCSRRNDKDGETGEKPFIPDPPPPPPLPGEAPITSPISLLPGA